MRNYYDIGSSFSVKLALRLCILLAVWVQAPQASAQAAPSLELHFADGHPTLSLTGAVGTIYSIQYATGLSPTNSWVDRTLVQAKVTSFVWTDPDAPSPAQRFYRAVSVPPPADTNMVFIQSGKFIMGSPTNEVDRYDSFEGPQTAVTITRGFWMGKYEVTQGEYLSLMGFNPSGNTGDTNQPVDTVSWFNATDYCAALTQQERAAGRIATNLIYRLPTQAEWEYACRAGTTNRFSYGDDLGYTSLASYGWYEANASSTSHPVGQKLPNPWGLYDMHGNVWEWCKDWFVPYLGGIAIDPDWPLVGTDRGLRGGSYASPGADCRSAKVRWMDWGGQQGRPLRFPGCAGPRSTLNKSACKVWAGVRPSAGFGDGANPQKAEWLRG